MSMPFIVCHDESIYTLQEKELHKLIKPPLYHSKFSKNVRIESGKNKELRRTMGYAEVHLEPPNEYLKKNEGVKRPTRKVSHVCVRKDLAQVPRFCELDEPPTRPSKKFIVENIKAAIKAHPKRPLPRYIDTRIGDRHDVVKSGLMPTHVYQPKFGKLPKYLMKRIRDAAQQAELHRDEEARKQPLCRYLTQEERSDLLGGLKHNWEELQKIYQGLPVLTDTIPKAMRQNKLETELKQLERDIMLIENHPYVYIYDDEKERRLNAIKEQQLLIQQQQQRYHHK